MKREHVGFIAVGVFALLASGCGGLTITDPPPAPLAPQTRAEATDYRETSTYDDVMAFMRALPGDGSIAWTFFGQSVEGRDLPLAVWGSESVAPEAIRATGKTRVLVFANIHAGEVAGKEAALMLIRDLAGGAHAEWADSLVVMIAPIYNADGNERVAYDNRPGQLGPVGGMGQRPNADGLDLNRDFMKLASPEARALVGLLRDVDPHVVVDLHTTNGTFMGYHLTFAPPLSPNTPEAIDRDLRERWIPRVTAGAEASGGWFFEHYGNVPGAFGEGTSVPRGWYSFSPQPRFGTNYAGLRGRYALLSEAYSYAPFEERVGASKRFVEEVLRMAWADASGVRATTAAADRQRLAGDSLAVRGGFVAPESTREIYLAPVDTLLHPETGAPMYRARMDERAPEAMPVFSRFGATEREAVPLAYVVPRSRTEVLDLLAAHGVRVEDGIASGEIQRFRVDSVRVAERPFQNVRQQEAFGVWEPLFGDGLRPPPLVPSTYVSVPMDQPLARVAFMLLEPRSDDGVVNWAIVPLAEAAPYPILRTRPAR